MSGKVGISYETTKRIYVRFMKCGWCYKTAVPLKAFIYVKSAISGSISVIYLPGQRQLMIITCRRPPRRWESPEAKGRLRTRQDLEKRFPTFFFRENIWGSQISLDGFQTLFGDYLNKNTRGSPGSRDQKHMPGLPAESPEQAAKSSLSSPGEQLNFKRNAVQSFSFLKWPTAVTRLIMTHVYTSKGWKLDFLRCQGRKLLRNKPGLRYSLWVELPETGTWLKDPFGSGPKSLNCLSLAALI